MSTAQGSRIEVRFWLLGLALWSAACATAPPAPSKPPEVTWDDKLSWILRLEDQRILRDPNPPAPVVLVPAAKAQPAILAPPPPSDLLRLLRDDEGRTRRRAALAVGRVGLPAAAPDLMRLLDDPEAEVRQMAAFALGLIGDASARPALLKALGDDAPIVQGRSAEAIGAIGDTRDATAVAMMIKGHIDGGALMGVGADDLAWPLAPPVEAVRLGLFALARLRAYDALAASVLTAPGTPVSTWWPVAYTLGAAGDTRAAPALLALLPTAGRFTAAFAARGLASLKAQDAASSLRTLVAERRRDPAIVVEALRALGAIRDPLAAPVLERLLAENGVEPRLRIEAAAAMAAIHSPDMLDPVIDLLSDAAPGVRGSALRTLAQIDPDTFLTTLSGLDTDADWTVRVSLAEALATVPDGRGAVRLMAMLTDAEPRVIPAVLRALVAARAPGVEGVLIARLTSPDVVIRATAAGGLGELKAVAAMPALLDAYRRSAEDVAYGARAALLTAVSTVDPTAARPLLDEALRDREWAMRVKAASLLRDRGVAEAGAGRPAPATQMPDAEWRALLAPPYSPHAFIDFDKGTIEVELAIADAPLTVSNFVRLSRQGFFNGVAVHRVVPDFVVQGGDPRGDGEGGPGYTIRDEINEQPYLRGTVGMALDWKDTGGSQFFITHSPQPHLDARYTVFGRVVAGIDVVDRLDPWDVIRRVRIWDGVTFR